MRNYLMKKKQKLVGCLLLLVSLAISGCKDMHDIYAEHVVPNGSKYPGKIQSIVAHSGHNRVVLGWRNTKDPAVNKVRVFWNNYKDSVEMDITERKDSSSLSIQPLNEGNYNFVVYTYDREMRRSVPLEVQGIVYGEVYSSYLSNSVIVEDKILENEGLSINWGTPDTQNGMIGTRIIYRSNQGNEKTVVIPSTEKKTFIDDFDTFSNGYQYQALFLPNELSVDTFSVALDRRIPTMALDRRLWTVTASSFEATAQIPVGGGPPEKTLDGDVNTFWHSKHTGTMVPFPHWLAYDMKKKILIEKIVLTARPGKFNKEDFNKFIIQSSNNGTDWTDHGSFTFADIDDPQVFLPQTSISARYFRIYMTAGPQKYSHLAEVEAYGRAVDL
ncbi:hypothetical protein M472_19090 [Sphingobacterium paucimobilis HER1398]|uniref:F5/8 type C domain-containing protein n=2 Tax=Sphingobacterium TaxID=28453 RepID=U2JDV5_9SPHI|nr:hypothetical protein M472_19090 [Sphingobacterium paucimobilis HER1398]